MSKLLRDDRDALNAEHDALTNKPMNAAACKRSDEIVVEARALNELMALGGLYAGLYGLQARQYA
jgi:hypothetical protein